MNRHWTGYFAAVLSLGVAAPAGAFFVNPQISQTAGTHQYEGTTASVDVGGAFHVTPAFYDYHSNATGPDGFKTYSLRAAYDTDGWGVGLSGGATPKTANDAYSNDFFGADAIVSLSPGTGQVKRLQQFHQASAQSQPNGWQAPTSGLAGVTLGAGVTYIDHKADLGAQGSGGTQMIGQTNLRGSLGLSFFDVLGNVDVTKSVYSQSLSGSGLQAAPVQILPGLSAIVQGFPDVSANVKVSLGMIPVVTPYVSYTHTTFEQGLGASGAYTVGGSVDLLMLTVNAFYERYVQIGAPDQNFLGIGAGLSF